MAFQHLASFPEHRDCYYDQDIKEHIAEYYQRSELVKIPEPEKDDSYYRLTYDRR